jgi:hypothetical protein
VLLHVLFDLALAGPPVLDDVTSVEAHDATCAIRKGAVWCWGPGVSSVATRVDGLAGVVQIAGSAHRWCARTKRGKVTCWRDAQSLVPLPGAEAHDIALVEDAVCAATRTDVRCTRGEGWHTVFDGPFDAVEGADDALCAVASGRLRCASTAEGTWTEVDQPAVVFDRFEMQPGVQCGLSDGVVRCRVRIGDPLREVGKGTSFALGFGWVCTHDGVEGSCAGQAPLSGREPWDGQPIAIGSRSRCQLADGLVTCTGEPGTLGDGQEPMWQARGVTVRPERTVRPVPVRDPCRLEDGDVVCNTRQRGLPQRIEGPFVDLYAGWDVACGRTVEGQLRCDGDLEALLGQPTASPLVVDDVEDVVMGELVVVLRTDGTLRLIGPSNLDDSGPEVRPFRMRTISSSGWIGTATRELAGVDAIVGDGEDLCVLAHDQAYCAGWGLVPALEQVTSQPVQGIATGHGVRCMVQEERVHCASSDGYEHGVWAPMLLPDAVSIALHPGPLGARRLGEHRGGGGCAELTTGQELCWRTSTLLGATPSDPTPVLMAQP